MSYRMSCGMVSCVLLAACGWQVDSKGATSARRGRHIKFAVVTLDDVLRNGQSQTRPLPCRLGGEEGFEDRLQLLDGYTGAIVVVFYVRLAVGKARRNANLAVALHGLRRVYQQVDKDLGKLAFGAGQHGHGLVVLARDPDLVLELVAGKIQGCLDAAMNIKRGEVVIILMREAFKVTDDSLDAFDAILRFIDEWAVIVEDKFNVARLLLRDS